MLKINMVELVTTYFQLVSNAKINDTQERIIYNVLNSYINITGIERIFILNILYGKVKQNKCRMQIH